LSFKGKRPAEGTESLTAADKKYNPQRSFKGKRPAEGTESWAAPRELAHAQNASRANDPLRVLKA